MNVLFLTSTLPRFKNDQQSPFVIEQAQAWRKACPTDQIYLLAPDHYLAKKTETIEGISISRFQYFFPRKLELLAYPAILPNLKRNLLLILQIPFFLMAEFFSTIKLVKRKKINLIYAHWVMPQGLISYFANKILGIEYVLQNHSSDLKIFRKIPLVGKWLAQRIIKSAKLLFCVNKNLQHEAKNFFNDTNHKQIQNKIIALPMGVNMPWRDEKNQIPDDTNTHISSNYQYDFGLIGRLSKKKGADHFIQALKILNNQNLNFKAAIAGDGEERGPLEELSKNMGIDFLGFLSGPEKLNFFKNTQYLIYPSCPAKGDVEGLPVAILEALYLGKTIVASTATNIELIPEWEAIKQNIFLLSDPCDSDEFSQILQKLIARKNAEMDTFDHNTSKSISRYHWDNLIHEYLSCIKSNNKIKERIKA